MVRVVSLLMCQQSTMSKYDVNELQIGLNGSAVYMTSCFRGCDRNRMYPHPGCTTPTMTTSAIKIRQRDSTNKSAQLDVAIFTPSTAGDLYMTYEL